MCQSRARSQIRRVAMTAPRIMFETYTEIANQLPHMVLAFQFSDGTQEWYGVPAELFRLGIPAATPYEYRTDDGRKYVWCNAMDGHQRANALTQIYPLKILIVDGDSIRITEQSIRNEQARYAE